MRAKRSVVLVLVVLALTVVLSPAALADALYIPLVTRGYRTRVVLRHDNDTPSWVWTGAAAESQAGVIYDVSSPLALQTVEAGFEFSEDMPKLVAKAHVYRVTATSPTLQLDLVASSDQVEFPEPGHAFTGMALVEFPLSAPVRVEGQIMLAIEYRAGEYGSTPGLLMDSQKEIPQGIAWVKPLASETWAEHYDFWDDPEGKGYLMIRGYGEPL